MTTTANQSLDDARTRNANDAATTTRGLAWFFVLLTGLLAATWFALLLSRAFAGWFTAE